MITIGPWRFTEQDSRRTIDVLPEVVAHACWQRPPQVTSWWKAACEAVQHHRGPLADQLNLAWQLMTSIRPRLAAYDLLPHRQVGEVRGVFSSKGGVPKHPITSAVVDFGGLAGDRQATRVHHGRPWQALCLWSAEVVEDFGARGHSIFPGAAGENLSLRCIDWQSVKPGVRLRMGGVLCEVSAYTIPCRKNAQWFANGAFNTMHHEAGPVSRVYATVLEPGTIAPGDPATLEP